MTDTEESIPFFSLLLLSILIIIGSLWVLERYAYWRESNCLQQVNHELCDCDPNAPSCWLLPA